MILYKFTYYTNTPKDKNVYTESFEPESLNWKPGFVVKQVTKFKLKEDGFYECDCVVEGDLNEDLVWEGLQL